MSSDSATSWHPAFMPNSEAELVATKNDPLIRSSSEPEYVPESVQAATVASTSSVGTSQVVGETVDRLEERTDWGNDGHPELSNLRDALSTSLAGPGGVELDNSPSHNEVQDGEIEETEKADFPSEGPSSESKHLSTMSFARTVSHEVNWGEEDDVDPEWNLHRSDTDPFKFMAKSDRTNSFPVVPPAHSGLGNLEEQLPQSQAEDIMNEVEQEGRDLFADDGDDAEADFFTGASSKGDAGGHFLQDEHGGASHFIPSYGRDVAQDNEEGRFEEGLPLVQNNDDFEHRDRAQQGTFGSFGDDAHEDDFFASVSNKDNAPQPHLERKSTMQVLDSLSIQSNSQVHNDIIEEEDEKMDAPQSSLDKTTGGGIGVSTSTVLSQVLGDPAAPIHGEREALAALEMDSGEGDLAAKWKAALAGDEFLDDDDDELLPDDDHELAEAGNESKALDPSDLFGSDDEGFLEDTDEQDSSNPLFHQTSPPVLAPVTSPNGHVVGFDSLTGAAQTRPGSSGNSRYVPAGATSSAPKSANSYAPAAPLLTDLSRSATAATSVPLPSPYMSPTVSNFQTQSQRPELPKAQSFADKAKGGYESPYDLPMEVVKPRKRTSMQQMNRQPSPANIQPPRSSSMYTQPPPPASNSSMSPPTSSHGVQPAQATSAAVTSQSQPAKKSSSGFFEELPMSSKPKPAPRQNSSYGIPIQNPYGHPATAPPPIAPPPATASYAAAPVQQDQAPPNPTQRYPVQQQSNNQGLVAPERVSPYAALPVTNNAQPAIASRYSPSPSQTQLQPAIPPPVAQSRYSPAPPTSRQQSYTSVNAPPPVLAHQPRTSSPLAHFERTQNNQPHNSHSEIGSFDRRSSSSGYESNLRHQHLPPTKEVDENSHSTVNGMRNYGELQHQSIPQPPPTVAQTPPPPQNIASRLVSSPPKRTPSNYQPQQTTSNGPPAGMVAPKRSQTQSPGSGYGGQRGEVTLTDPYQRPASVENPMSPRGNGGYSAPSVTSSYGRKRGFSQGYNYIAPTDGREHDPLQRWKGAPVFAWGLGGMIVTSFPQDVPRYGMGQTAPMIIRSPGEIKIRSIKDIDPLPERLSAFPGPLKGKSKKKDVLSWLTSGIAILEQDATYLRTTSHLSHEDKRTEERILLWKILQVFLEHDGLLEGTPVVEKAVRAVLSPGLDDEASSATPLYATGAELSGISASPNAKADAVDPAAVDELRKHLLRGEREKAVWEAVDKRLWAHAMLISNTVSRDLYKRVSQEFVQKEVKNIGDNTQPLAALYEIFAGNFEESIDELVPPSARAGYQLVSASNAAGPSKDALEGLDRWRETLSLVLSNRSPDDNQALNAMGKLLSGYGRAEAAHICFLFARSLSIFGGVDDPQASIVLIGSDQLRQPYDFDREMEPILLSEVFEYGLSLANPSAIAPSTPHLAVYKLQHAKILAENGHREKALQYCETIATSISSQTRRSPYHHALLVSELDDLTKRLKSSPKDGSASWISKPSIDKAKGSIFATFTNFIAGDEGDTPVASNAEVGNDVGPFARIAGGTPTISRSPSISDIHASYSNGMAIPIGGPKTNSRYAPGGSYGASTYEPQSTSYGSQPRTSLDERSSNEFRRYEPQRQMSDYRPASQAGNAVNNNFQTSSPYAPQSAHSPQVNTGSPYAPISSYAQPQTPVNEQPQSNLYSSPQPINHHQPHESSPPRLSQQESFNTPSINLHPMSSSYDPSAPSGYNPPSATYVPSTPSYSPLTGLYEPPSNGYEPPAYEPMAMNDEPDSPVDTLPKKKSFMDDDDDDIPALKQPSSTQEKTKAEKDREADEAFKRAAEADAQKAKESAPAKKGWGLGGWFGGSKKEAADMGAQPNKAIRAKLGEASSFVYDPELKRWINKKGGSEATEAKTATPPPPRAGPPRTSSVPPPTSTPRPMSSSGAPPPMANRAVSDTTPSPPRSNEQGESAGLPSLAPPAMARSASNGSIGMNSVSASGPPSRPGTGMSNASSIDDLLGPAMPRKGGAAAKKAVKKKGRGYVDVMGEKAT